MIIFKRDFEKNKLNTTLLCFYPLKNTTSVQPQRLKPTFIIYDMTWYDMIYIYIYIYTCVCVCPSFGPYGIYNVWVLFSRKTNDVWIQGGLGTWSKLIGHCAISDI